MKRLHIFLGAALAVALVFSALASGQMHDVFVFSRSVVFSIDIPARKLHAELCIPFFTAPDEARTVYELAAQLVSASS